MGTGLGWDHGLYAILGVPAGMRAASGGERAVLDCRQAVDVPD
jgi:hypothetical protein